MKTIKFCLILIILITAFSSCVGRPTPRTQVVVVKKHAPAKVIVVKAPGRGHRHAYYSCRH